MQKSKQIKVAIGNNIILTAPTLKYFSRGSMKKTVQGCTLSAIFPTSSRYLVCLLFALLSLQFFFNTQRPIVTYL